MNIDLPIITVSPEYNEEQSMKMNNGSINEVSRNVRKNELLNSETNLIKPQNSQFEFVWKDINISATIKSKGKTEQKKILDNSSGRVKSGECFAILGSSGAGKTTLLNFLSKKIESKTLTMAGEVLLNQKVVTPDIFGKISSYVMQDDILEPCMTPLEILLFTAKLKLNLPVLEIEQRVHQMIVDLHLTKCQNTKIGDALTRGVSGGERKRTSIGVELISNPLVVFLDEPTTGLDSFNAYEVISLLNNLAKTGKIVIFTIHQPASEIFQLLDKVCILALGKTVYFGRQDRCYNYFEKAGLPVPNNYNPFEHFMEVTNVTAIENEKILNNFPELSDIEDKQERYQNYVKRISSIYEENKEKYVDNTSYITSFSDDNLKQLNDRKHSPSYCLQFSLLFGRNLIISMRNPKVLMLKLAQNIFTALLVCALFVRLSKDFTGIQDRLGAILLGLVSSIFGNNTATLLSFSTERKVFTRERANNLYSVALYYITKTLTEIPGTLIACCIYSVLTFWTLELNDTYVHKYFSFIGILFLGALCGSGYSYVLGAFLGDNDKLISLNTAVIIPLLLLSGFFATAENFAPYMIPFKYLSAFKYVYQLLTHIEFSSAQPYNCVNVTPDLCSPLATRFNYFEPFYVSIIGLCALIVFLRILGLTLFYFYAKIKV